MPIEPALLNTDDGLRLEAEVSLPSRAATAAVVLAHPHPQQGGTMRSIVPGTLFSELPSQGVAALRFNFRGVGRSEGSYANGIGEQNDILAAVDHLAMVTGPGVAVILAGWSFGADVCLAVADPRVAGWFAAAPPLRVIDPGAMPAATDARPKLLAVPERDQFRPPSAARDIVAGWTACEIAVVAGADHFFIGRTNQLTPLCMRLIHAALANRTAGPTPAPP